MVKIIVIHFADVGLTFNFKTNWR